MRNENLEIGFRKLALTIESWKHFGLVSFHFVVFILFSASSFEKAAFHFFFSPKCFLGFNPAEGVSLHTMLLSEASNETI